MRRGYFGIGIYHPKTTENIGTLWRSAHNFDADFIFTVGARYHKQPSDTTKAHRHVPLYHYKDMADLKSHLPQGAELVFVEQAEGSADLPEFEHPEAALYVLGAEDYGVPEDEMRGYRKVAIATPLCLDVAVAGSIVLYDRQTKIRRTCQ
jgi:tRNA(Leu) C34 or U34 (ribose-2'-O)-methylase TrmL